MSDLGFPPHGDPRAYVAGPGIPRGGPGVPGDGPGVVGNGSGAAGRRRWVRRAWVIANLTLLVLVSGWVVRVTAPEPPDAATLATGGSPTGGPGAPPSGAGAPGSPVLSRASVLGTRGQRFGVSYREAPFGPDRLAAITRDAGAAPTLLEYFVKWPEEFRPEFADACYRNGALPVVSWEPWRGLSPGIDQPEFRLDRIAAGAHDGYLTRFAAAVRDYRKPIVLRFAHEMNGNWYSWSERRSGNRPGSYVRAWRHVHDVFRQVGAVNVVWVWSPNIIRPVPHIPLEPLYPGDAYVDWVGMVGYATGERTASAVFDPTLRQIRTFTNRPLLITETGAWPDQLQATWTASLFDWLAVHREFVVGFIWFEYNKAGATGDWRFSRSPRTRAAFRSGVTRSGFLPPVRS